MALNSSFRFRSPGIAARLLAREAFRQAESAKMGARERREHADLIIADDWKIRRSAEAAVSRSKEILDRIAKRGSSVWDPNCDGRFWK